MNRHKLLETLRERFPEAIADVYERSAKRVYVQIESDWIVRTAEFLFREIGARFNTASGVDGRNEMEILYHFTIEEIDLIVTLRVILEKTKLQVDSLTSVSRAAFWVEREMHELLGVDFVGHPRMERLLLPEDWPPGVYPLRKDYEEWDPNAVRDRGA